MNYACPNCGVIGTNVSCPSHVNYSWGTWNGQPPTIQPQVTWMPVPEQSVWSSLYAEIGRLNVLLNERDKEIERLRGLMPPDERGPGFVGQGSWSVFAEKVVAERDALREELAERDKEIERLKSLMPPDDTGFLGKAWSLIAEKLRLERDALREELAERDRKIEWLRRERTVLVAWLRKMTTMGSPITQVYLDQMLESLANWELAVPWREYTDQFGRTLPLEGHHKDCGYGKDGWSLCTCDELKKADEERATKQFQLLVEEGQDLRKEFDQKTAGMRGPPQCSKCGDTGLVSYGPNLRGMKRCDCRKESLIKEGGYTRKISEASEIDRALDDLMVDDQETCEHGNLECKRCKPVRSMRTPEGKPLLPTRDFQRAAIEDNKERGITECGGLRQTGRTTAMVIQALEFVKQNSMGGVVIEVDGQRMRKRVKELLLHYADEMGVGHRENARIFTKTPNEHISGIDIGLQLRDNVIDDVKNITLDRDPRQDLKVGDIVRFEIKGVITARQSAGIVKDYDGNDYEPIQYEITDLVSGNKSYIPYNRIIKVIGKEK